MTGIAVVTGASSGIGAATARRLAEAQRLGFRRAIVPAGSELGGGLPIEVREASNVRTAIAIAIGG